MSQNRKVLLDLIGEMKDNDKPVSFLGAKVSSPADLAKVAEIVRSPRYETFHYLFTKDGEVKGTTAVSCRLAGSTRTIGGYDSNKFYSELLRRAKGVEADTFYFLHNHPSGNPSPSRHDIVFTKDAVKDITKKSKLNFGGHVVINSKSYALLDENGDYEILPIAYNNSYKIEDKRNADSFFNTTVKGPEDFAACAKLMQKSENSFYMIGLSTRNKCNCLYQISYDILNDPAHNLIKDIRKWSYVSGVERYGLINFSTNKIDNYRKSIFFKQLGKSGYILDILTQDGTSLRATGDFNPARHIKKRTVHQVHEYDSHYESSSVQLSPFRTWLNNQNIPRLTKAIGLDNKEELRFYAFLEERVDTLPISSLWKLDEALKECEVIILNEEVEPNVADKGLLSARQRVADAVERIRSRAIHKPFESSDSISNQIVNEANCLSIALHGQYYEGMTWNHYKGTFVDEAYVPALTDSFKDSIDPDYIKSLIRKYTSSIDQAQNQLASITQSKRR